MKKILSCILLCALLVSCLFVLSACAPKLSGSYQADMVAVKITYAFESNGKMTLTMDPLIGGNISLEGTYEINEDTNEITISLNSDNADANKYAGTFSFAQGTEGDNEYIKINGIQYTKIG